MEDKCHLWENYKLSWFGRIAAVKMVQLPRLIFILLNASIDVPETTVNRNQAIINRFIWNRERPRLKLTMVEKNLQNDGIAIPNIK